MKRVVWTLGIVFTTAIVAIAQPPGAQRGQGGGREGGAGRGGDQPPPPPPNPIVDVLDTDGDHVISSSEIANAPASLAKLDLNQDGKLTEEEFRPRPPGGGPGGGSGGPGPRGDGQRGAGQRNQVARGQDAAGGRGPGGPDGGPGRGGPQGGPGGPDRFVNHAMQFDADNDGKLNRDELARFAEDFARMRGGPGGPGGGPGGNSQGDSSRTERPRRPE